MALYRMLVCTGDLHADVRHCFSAGSFAPVTTHMHTTSQYRLKAHSLFAYRSLCTSRPSNALKAMASIFIHEHRELVHLLHWTLCTNVHHVNVAAIVL